MASESSSSGNIGIGGVLLVVFIVLKLVGVIAWSWWWVLSPLWIGFALLVVAAIVAATLANALYKNVPSRKGYRGKR